MKHFVVKRQWKLPVRVVCAGEGIFAVPDSVVSVAFEQAIVWSKTIALFADAGFEKSNRFQSDLLEISGRIFSHFLIQNLRGLDLPLFRHFRHYIVIAACGEL